MSKIKLMHRNTITKALLINAINDKQIHNNVNNSVYKDIENIAQ